YDETVSVWLARQDLAEITRHTAGDIHPPLYYYLLHFWGTAAGWSEFSIAFLSLIFGVLIVALAYRLARDLFGGRTALLAAGLIALSPYNVWYSQEVRMYTLAACLALGACSFGARLVQDGAGVRRANPLELLLFILLNAAGLYTLYYFVFFLVFEDLVVLYLLVTRYSLRDAPHALRIWLLSQVAIILLYAPWFPNALRQALDPPVPPWREFTPLPTVLLQATGALTLGQSIDPMVALPIVLLSLFLIVYAFLVTRDNRRKLLVYSALLGFTFVPLALIFLLSLWKPLYHVRYVFMYSPAYYILFAASIAAMPQGRTRTTCTALTFGVGALVVLVVLSVYSLYNFWFNPQYATDDLRGAVQHIRANWRPGDVILVNAGYAYTSFVYFDRPFTRERLSSYQPGASDTTQAALVMTGSIDGNPSLGWGDPQSDFYSTTALETLSGLDRVFASSPRVWMLRIYDTVVDPKGVIREYFAEHATLIDDTAYAGEANARVQGFLTTRELPKDIPVNVTHVNRGFAGRVTLAGYLIMNTDVRAGQDWNILLYWRAEQQLNYNYHVSVQ
ncbi:MAG TPA: glycosyltransferase family 39 protein, partial [Anaerolineae bacterium]